MANSVIRIVKGVILVVAILALGNLTYKQVHSYYDDYMEEYMIEAISLYDARNDGFTLGEKQGLALGEKRGISIGILQKSIDAAKKLLSTGLSKEQIASCLDLSIEKVEELAKEEKNS